MRQEERDRLIVEHLWVPRHAVAQQLSHVKTISREDLLGLAVEALVEAGNRFDPIRGVKFSTFAFLCCYRKVHGSLRTAERRAKRLGGVQPILLNVPGRRNNGVMNVENAEFFEALKSRAILSVQGRDRRIVAECLIGGKTYAALARELGVTPQAVSCAARRIKERLKVELEEMKELYYG